jgi:hypothetical protein
MKHVFKLALCLFLAIQLDSAWAIGTSHCEDCEPHLLERSCGYELYVRRMPWGAVNHLKLAWLLEELLGKTLHDINRSVTNRTLLAWTASYEFAEYIQRLAKELGCDIEIKMIC